MFQQQPLAIPATLVKMQQQTIAIMNFNRHTEGTSPRSGWRLSSQHQLAIALLAVVSLAVVGISYGWSVWRGDQGDIDQVDTTPLVFQVDVNRAAVGELMAVPNVGPKMAQAIVDHRDDKGLFESLEELEDVPGVGPVKLEHLKKYLLPIK